MASFRLLENGTDYRLQEDGTSKLLLEQQEEDVTITSSDDINNWTDNIAIDAGDSGLRIAGDGLNFWSDIIQLEDSDIDVVVGDSLNNWNDFTDTDEDDKKIILGDSIANWNESLEFRGSGVSVSPGDSLANLADSVTIDINNFALNFYDTIQHWTDVHNESINGALAFGDDMLNMLDNTTRFLAHFLIVTEQMKIGDKVQVLFNRNRIVADDLDNLADALTKLNLGLLTQSPSDDLDNLSDAIVMTGTNNLTIGEWLNNLKEKIDFQRGELESPGDSVNNLADAAVINLITNLEISVSDDADNLDDSPVSEQLTRC